MHAKFCSMLVRYGTHGAPVLARLLVLPPPLHSQRGELDGQRAGWHPQLWDRPPVQAGTPNCWDWPTVQAGTDEQREGCAAFVRPEQPQMHFQLRMHCCWRHLPSSTKLFFAVRQGSADISRLSMSEL